ELNVRVQIILRSGKILKTATLSYLDASVERISWLINTYLVHETRGHLVGALDRLAVGNVSVDFKDKNVLEQQIDSFVKIAARADSDGVARSPLLIAAYCRGYSTGGYEFPDSFGARVVFRGTMYKISLHAKAENIPAIVGLAAKDGFVIVHEESGLFMRRVGCL
ncbi:hypothetical protein HDU99_000941, partial [Rhizoclosmatium hyalinum]